MNLENLTASLANTVRWWRRADTGRVRGTIKYQLRDLLDAEDQLWCELAGIVQIDSTPGENTTDPRYPPGLDWTWSTHFQCWLPNTENWQEISSDLAQPD